MESETTPLLKAGPIRERGRKAAETETLPSAEAIPSGAAVPASEAIVPRDWVKKAAETAPEHAAELTPTDAPPREWTRTLLISLLFFLVGAEGALIGVLLVSGQSERARADTLTKRIEALEVRTTPTPPPGK
jgi:hypothetical protein